MPAPARVDRSRHTHPDIRIANPGFRIDAGSRCICAREAAAKDTFDAVRGRHEIACIAWARNAPRPLRQA
ncbi:hypothetical protein DIE07_15065 [Burkholderia sp. Bp9002]|nr:hypothetical protein DIE07_15065 [Burkholderia sp. Bp9002]